ncbi:5-dehydro-2-deoxygluconokinase [Cohnella boryungensis]|uniref:5-dehydro-2-deoxygluconokinase n=1 Tax=Cohnella boryungensis TaxID=768479 RepID=A0ABV8S4I1_9BACL
MSLIQFQQHRELDLIGVGRLCIDLNANEINRPMELTRTFTKYVGGSPANITIALSKLGKKTGFIGRIADDQHGRFIMNYLQECGVDTSNVVKDLSGSVTGLVFTEIKSPEECSILMYRDNVADLKLEPGDVSEAYIKRAKAILISGTALAKSPSREAVFIALEYARKHDVVVIFDIDYRPRTWVSLAEVGAYCRLVAEKSDIILGGREEFDLLEDLAGQARDDRETANMWFEHRAKIVLVKHGGAGSTAFTRDGQVLKGVTYKANVVKTFGAGDSFAGAFIYGLMNGLSVEESQRLGAASASIVVSSHSSSDAMPTIEKIQALIQSAN